VANADRLFAASANQSSRLEVIAGHDHLDTYTHNPAAYMSVLLAFIGQQLAHTAATCPNIETGRLNPRPGQLSGRGEPCRIASTSVGSSIGAELRRRTAKALRP
jgi:hypothetical protein